MDCQAITHAEAVVAIAAIIVQKTDGSNPTPPYLATTQKLPGSMLAALACKDGRVKIIVLLSIAVVAVVLTVLGIIWSSPHSIRLDPENEGLIIMETPDTPWQAQRGKILGIGGAALGFVATMIALFTES
ncbi:hypothetical protein GCM10007170_18490 [Arthrobacter liuii]|uniref:Uncharacterized protein n=1 Tax=Arthrobacter liuii TaxID=1476996 RepID=A0ABQ2ANM8_9MICC|nr:hypothetical protein GCM10007170_18490 [Arthrobacter liuii]